MPQFVDTELIFDRRPVVEALRGPRRVYEIFATEQAQKWLEPQLRKYSITKDFRLRTASKQKLYTLVGRPDHQGIVARVSGFEYTPLELLVARSPEIILAADGITDPHNLGAVIRSVNLCGGGGVVIPQKNSARITPVVVHTSAGATEHTPIALTESLPHAIQIFKDHGYFIAAADVPSEESTPITQFEPPEKIVLVMGAEGTGISGKIRRKTDALISIPQAGQIDSFNVSVAAGILLFELAVKMGILP